MVGLRSEDGAQLVSQEVECLGSLEQVGARPEPATSQDRRRWNDMASADGLSKPRFGGAEPDGSGTGGCRERRKNSSMVGVIRHTLGRP
jgi:hypothetical protein